MTEGGAGIQEAYDAEPTLFKTKVGARPSRLRGNDGREAGIQEAYDAEPALFKTKVGARALPACAGMTEGEAGVPTTKGLVKMGG